MFIFRFKFKPVYSNPATQPRAPNSKCYAIYTYLCASHAFIRSIDPSRAHAHHSSRLHICHYSPKYILQTAASFVHILRCISRLISENPNWYILLFLPFSLSPAASILSNHQPNSSSSHSHYCYSRQHYPSRRKPGGRYRMLSGRARRRGR